MNNNCNCDDNGMYSGSSLGNSSFNTGNNDLMATTMASFGSNNNFSNNYNNQMANNQMANNHNHMSNNSTQPVQPIRGQQVNNPSQRGLDVLNQINHAHNQPVPIPTPSPMHNLSNLNKVSPQLGSENLGSELKETVNDSYLLILKNINLAFILVAAFAWNDAIKYYIARTIKLQKGTPYYYLYYALIASLLAVISVRITKKYLIKQKN